MSEMIIVVLELMAELKRRSFVINYGLLFDAQG